MVDPKQNPVIADSALMQADKFGRQVVKRFPQSLRACNQLPKLLPHSLSDRFVQFAEGALEVRSCC